MESDDKLELIRNACEEKKATDLVIMDLRGKTLIADFFVLCSGNSKIQVRAIADGLIEAMKKSGVKGVRSEGYEQGTWILLDYGDVVAHVFAQEEREYYKLEDLWRRSARTEPVEAARAETEDRSANDADAPALAVAAER